MFDAYSDQLTDVNMYQTNNLAYEYAFIKIWSLVSKVLERKLIFDPTFCINIRICSMAEAFFFDLC